MITVQVQITPTKDHIRETLELELVRRKYMESMLTGENFTPCPERTYCASCPIANAAYDITWSGPYEVYSISVDGTYLDLSTHYREIVKIMFQADLPGDVKEWIEEFDFWVQHSESTDDQVEQLEALLADEDSWPAVPAPFTLELTEFKEPVRPLTKVS
jgi:hypothetical protein